MTEDQKQTLEKQLWNIANDLRGKMDPNEFKDYILGIIFYKYLSERQQQFANGLLIREEIKEYKDIKDEADIGHIRELSLPQLGYFLKPDQLFSAMLARGQAPGEEKETHILGDLDTAFTEIEQSTQTTDSEDDFNHLFQDIDLDNSKLGREPKDRNDLIVSIMSHLNRIDFGLEESDSDILGDAYEYLIGKFAAGAGRKAGEFYTPQQVSRILAKIVTLDKQRIKDAYDPTCGSGSLLLRIQKEARVADLYGQELNRTTYNLARMNMILHGVHFREFDIRQEDTLNNPQHEGMQFEAVVANPPFSIKWKGKANKDDDRFSQYGALAPSSRADFAFIQHMIHHLAENGVMAVVLPHGVLFRGKSEGVIRKYIIKELNCLDAVIGLPPNLFYGASIPTCILIMKKCRKQDEDILFIDASQHFEKAGKQNLLTDAHVNKIVKTYRQRVYIDKYAHVASLEDIEENDWNLNISRYVDTFEEEEPVDITAVAKDLKTLDLDMLGTDRTIQGFCRELGIESPF